MVPGDVCALVVLLFRFSVTIRSCRDNLRGTASYGAYVANPTATTSFAIPFAGAGAQQLMLLASGDFSSWLISTVSQIVGGNYDVDNGDFRVALKSSFIQIPCMSDVQMSLLVLKLILLIEDLCLLLIHFLWTVSFIITNKRR